MTAQFTTTALTNNRIMVQGTDKFAETGKVVLDATEFNELKKKERLTEAGQAFDAGIKDFFAPLNEVLDQIEKAKAANEPGAGLDELEYLVVQEKVEGVAAKSEVFHILQPSTVILRAIELGHEDRLVWVEGSLEVLAAEVEDDIEVPVATASDLIAATATHPAFGESVNGVTAE